MTVKGAVVSSTAIRRAVETGDFSTAAEMLGREYTILGTVKRGAQLGRQLGLSNSQPERAQRAISSRMELYVAEARLDGIVYPGVANLGHRPTIAGGAAERLLEFHLFDLDREIYGQDIRSAFCSLPSCGEKNSKTPRHLPPRSQKTLSKGARVLCRLIRAISLRDMSLRLETERLLLTHLCNRREGSQRRQKKTATDREENQRHHRPLRQVSEGFHDETSVARDDVSNRAGQERHGQQDHRTDRIARASDRQLRYNARRKPSVVDIGRLRRGVARPANLPGFLSSILIRPPSGKRAFQFLPAP